MKIVYLALAMLLAAAPESYAAADAFGSVKSKMIELFNNVKMVIFVLGGFGLVGLAAGAIMGSVKWKWFGSLAVGIIILAVAGKAIDYVTSTDAAGAMNDSM